MVRPIPSAIVPVIAATGSLRVAEGLEAFGDDMLFGLIDAMAGRGDSFDPAEWKWLAEDAAGNRQPEGRNYSPFFVSVAQAIKNRQAFLAAAG